VALNFEDQGVDSLASQVTALTGETKTEAMRRALEDRLRRLQLGITNPVTASDLRRFLEEEIWPTIPEDQRYRRMSRDELADILGYGSEGCPSP
jgi:antitoxin VapB